MDVQENNVRNFARAREWRSVSANERGRRALAPGGGGGERTYPFWMSREADSEPKPSAITRAETRGVTGSAVWEKKRIGKLREGRLVSYETAYRCSTATYLVFLNPSLTVQGPAKASQIHQSSSSSSSIATTLHQTTHLDKLPSHDESISYKFQSKCSKLLL